MSPIIEALWMLGYALLAAVGLAFTALTLYTWRTHRMYDHLPGPKRTSFFRGNQPEFAARFKRGSFFSETLYDWCMEHGNVYAIFILHKCLVFTADPEGVKALLVTENFPKSAQSYKSIGHLYGTRFLGSGLVTATNHDLWSERRAIMNPAFSRNLLKPMMSDFNRIADDLMDKLAEFADGRTVVTLFKEFNRATLDAIGKVAYGMDIDSIHDDKSPFPNAIHKTLEGFREYTRNPFERMNPFARREFKNEVKSAVQFLRKVAADSMDNRKEALKRGDYVPEDILSYIIKTLDTNDKDATETAIDDFITFFIAGQETTANTLSFAVMEIGRHPEVLEKLRTEVENVLGDRSYVDFNDLPDLAYTELVIKETLRLYPPGSLTFREITRDGFRVDGYDLPKGTNVAMSTFVSSRHPKFHKDPLTFDPERFLNEDTKPTAYTSFPFTLGPRICIGQNFARMESKVILSKLLQRFTIDLDPNQSFDIEETTTLRPKGGTRATLTFRG